MGGFGSGVRAARKCTVEESWRLRVRDVVEAVTRPSDRFDAGVIAARNAHGGDLWVHAGQVRSEEEVEQGMEMAISYWASAVPWLVEDAAQLTFTRPWFGGKRWWLRCSCGRRVAALYLRPDDPHFRCRHCHDLTYTSVQAHDRRVDYFKTHPAELLSLLHSSRPMSSVLILALKALNARLQKPRIPSLFGGDLKQRPK
jgi:hypothetical protein